MTSNPKLFAPERTMLEQFMDAARTRVTEAAGRVRAEDAKVAWLRNSDLTIGGIVAHLARMEDLWFCHKWDDAPPSAPWLSAPLDSDADWDFHFGAAQSIGDTLEMYRAACDASRARASRESSLDALSARSSFGQGPTSLRWIYLHMIDETAQHCGHLDLLVDAAGRGV